MGAKRLNTTFWQPSDLKVDADFPAQVDITIGAGYLDCSNLKISALRNLLGAPTSELYDLCNLPGTFVPGGESGKVNVWARFKPGQTAYVLNNMLPAACDANPTFTYTAPGSPPGASLGDFAGYNHNESTRPVYWASPHQSSYVIYGTQAIRGGLQRGKLTPILSGNVGDETYWSRVKVQVWRKVNAGAYSLVATSDYVDLSEPNGDTATLLYTLGTSGETIGNIYTICLRPVYMDVDGVTPLAVCEGGVEVFTYRKWGTAEDVAAALSLTTNSVSTSMPQSGNPTSFNYDFDINNEAPNAISLAVRLRAEDNDSWFNQTYLLTSEVTVPQNDSVNFAELYDPTYLPQTLYDGTFKLSVEVSVDNGNTWITLDYLGMALQHWQSM